MRLSPGLASCLRTRTMPTQIVDMDLDGSPPGDIELEAHARVWLVAWRAGVPVGATILAPDLGTRRVGAERVAEALTTLARAPDPIPRLLPGTFLPRVSVIVCTRDRPDQLPRALASLRAQSWPAFELVVVDNAPPDDRTRALVRARWPEAVYVVEPVPGLPRARNAGLAAATGEVLAFTDDDCDVARGWVETMARAFAADAALGCVTGPILPLELETPAQEAMEARGGFNRGGRRRRHPLGDVAGAVDPVQAWQFGAGGSFALRRACAAALGGFDEALWKSEDLDIFYRTLRAGWALSFEPGAAVRHRHLREWNELARRLFDWGWGYLAYLDKIARGDTPEYADRARRERAGWFRWQVGRLRAVARGHAGDDVPLPLVLREVAGGIVGARGYARACAAARRRARHGPAALIPAPIARSSVG